MGKILKVRREIPDGSNRLALRTEPWLRKTEP